MIVHTEGADVFYEFLGDGGSPVLLLHGWGCDMSLMRPLGERLKARHRVMMLDFPGHGQSGRPPEPWGVPEYAGCLRAVLDQAEFCPCAVIAHSFGARVTAYLAAEDPNRFTKIILTGAAGLRKPQSEEAKKRSEQYQRLKKWTQELKSVPGMKGLADRAQDRLREKYGSRDYNALDEEMRKTFVKVVNQDLADRYEKIRQSTLLIWGDQDAETPLWMGQKMEQLIPDAGLVIFEGGTHFAYLEQLDRFVLIAENFLG